MWRLGAVELLATLAWGQAVLFDGFLPNDGQFPPAVQFFHLSRFDPYYLTRDSFVLTNQVRIQIADIDAQTTQVGESPSPVLFNRYLGNAPARWQTGARLFRLVRMNNVYPGISATFAGPAVAGSGLGRILFTLAQGADPSRIRLRVLNTETTPFAGPSGVWYVGGRISGVFAVSAKATQNSVVVAGGLKIEPDYSLSADIPGRDSTLPTEFEVTFPVYDLQQYIPQSDGYLTMDTYYPSSFGEDGSVDTSACGYQCSDTVIAKLDAQGQPLWVTLFGGAANESTYKTAVSGEGVAVSGSTTSLDFPLTANAPHRSRAAESDTFLAWFDAGTGQLRNSTYAAVKSNWVQDVVPAPGGQDAGISGGYNDYENAITGYLLRWNPASNRIVYTVPIEARPWTLAFDSSSNLYYAATASSTVHAASLDASGAPYGTAVHFDVPDGWYAHSFHLQITAPGEIWFDYLLGGQSAYRGYRVWMTRASLARGTVLMNRQLAAAGAVARSALTPAGNLKVLLQGIGPTEPVTADAPLAAACPDTSYFAIFSAAGELRHATYVPNTDFDFAARNEPTGPPPASVSCLANSAGRMPSYGGMAAPGEIITVTGGGFGPSDVIYTQPGADGRYPLTAAGLRVRLDGADLPVIAAARGLVAVQVPYEISANGQLEVVENGVALPGISISRTAYSVGLFTTGAHDSFQNLPVLAALNQDGSVNSPENPAAPGTIVSVFGSGLGVLSPAPSTGGVHPIPPAGALAETTLLRACYRCDGILYLGSAPGLSSSVFQANLRLPAEIPGTGLRSHGLGIAVATSPRNLVIFDPQGVVYVR